MKKLNLLHSSFKENMKSEGVEILKRNLGNWEKLKIAKINSCTLFKHFLVLKGRYVLQ